MTVFDLAPRRAHAKAGCPCVPRSARGGEHLIYLEHGLALHRLVVRGLGAVRAVLWATARLDAEQAAELHLVVRMQLHVHRARSIDELEQRQVVQRPGFGQLPIVPHRAVSGARGGGGMYRGVHEERGLARPSPNENLRLTGKTASLLPQIG
jgi:hypothetical protein